MTDSIELRTVQEIRQEAIRAGAQDPLAMRFRIIRCDRFSGEMAGISECELGFREAVAATLALIARGESFDYFLEPSEYVQ